MPRNEDLSLDYKVVLILLECRYLLGDLVEELIGTCNKDRMTEKRVANLVHRMKLERGAIS